MPKLYFQQPIAELSCVDIGLGVNSIGRGEDCQITIPHGSVSTIHCEIVCNNNVLVVRDLGSTNGTFINGQPITRATLSRGQVLQLGEVALQVDQAFEAMPMPEITIPAVTPRSQEVVSVHLPDGVISCKYHLDQPAEWQESKHGELLCPECVRSVGLVGRAKTVFAKRSGGKCEPYQQKPTSKGILGKALKGFKKQFKSLFR